MKYEETVKWVNEVLEQYTMTLTLRQIYYRLVAKMLIPNTITAYKTLSALLVKARERGEVDDSRIEDRSRQVLGEGDWGYENFEEFLNEREQRFKESWEYWTRPLWETQPERLIIALEKDALSRLFTDIADRYRVKVYPTRGYGSYTYVKNMAGDLEGDITILYFGDYDPSGRDIQRDLEERLQRYGEINFKIPRLALTTEQIEEYELPPKPEDKATLEKLRRDPRTKTYGMQYAAELDALEPPVLQEIIDNAIRAHIDTEEWNTRLEQIKREREELKEKLSKLKIEWGA